MSRFILLTVLVLCFGGCTYPIFEHPLVDPDSCKPFPELHGKYKVSKTDERGVVLGGTMLVVPAGEGLPKGFMRIELKNDPDGHSESFAVFAEKTGSSYVIHLPQSMDEKLGDTWNAKQIVGYYFFVLTKTDTGFTVRVVAKDFFEDQIASGSLKGSQRNGSPFIRTETTELKRFFEKTPIEELSITYEEYIKNADQFTITKVSQDEESVKPLLIANPQAALSQAKELAKPLYGPGWEVYKPNENDDDELKIKKEIVLTIQEELAPKQRRVREGQEQVSTLLQTYQRMQEAKEAVHVNDKDELIKVAKDVLNRAWVVEENQMRRSQNGVGRPDEALLAKAFRLQCELRLLQLDRTEYEKYKQKKTLAAQTQIKQPKIPEVFKSSDDEELKIKKEIISTIQEELSVKDGRFSRGETTVFASMYTYQRMQAAKEAVHSDNKVELIKVARDALNAALATEENRVLRFNNAPERPDDVAEARSFRLQCELRLLQLDRTEYKKYKQEKSPAALLKIKQPEIPEVYKPNEDDDEELKIKKEIVRTIYWELDDKNRRVREGAEQVAILLHTYQRLQAAKDAVHVNDKDELIKVAKDMLTRSWVIETNILARVHGGVGRPDHAAEAKAFRLHCELRLLQLDRTEYEKYKQERSQLRKYIHKMIETAKSSEVFSSLGKYQISEPLVTMNPGENFELRTQVGIYEDSGQIKKGYIFHKAVFDGSEYQTQEFYWELEGKRTNFSVGDQ